ncbi:MAG: glycoside hydrolase family 16 protein [Bacteroidales bacterium]|nr:glycoside hydrolase family 16 protein [Bacteroidales bacterium]
MMKQLSLSAIRVMLCLSIFSVTNCLRAREYFNPTVSEGYHLVWADEFSADGPPDSANWRFEHGFVRNRELQWYQVENAYCRGGRLLIEARREQKPNPRYSEGSENWKTNREFIEYTSSSLLTRGLQSWKYGRFEMRAKIDTRPGLWPAFWTLGAEGPWPHNGEIDIMEYYDSTILANMAWGAEERWKAVWNTFKLPLDSLIKKDKDWTEKFHTWRMDWDEHSIKLYLDDLLLNTQDLSETINLNQERKNPFHQPHYIIINLAVGGTAGGDPSKTEFPALYEIDYVRVYQKKLH